MGKKKKNNNKIVPYRRPRNLNVGMIIFLLIFVYMSFSVYTYLKRDKVQVYEVVEGGIVNEKDYTGLILRDETTQNADRAGDINYYVREGKRASVGTSIYSIDETGTIAQFMEEHPEANTSLSEENMEDLKKQLSSFSVTYDDEKFQSVYDTKYTLEALVMEYSNFNSLENLASLIDQSGVNFQQVRTSQAGIVSYAVDSFEGMDPNTISADAFDRSKYTKAITKSGEKIAADTPVYKIVTSDNWSVLFQMDEEDIKNYQDQKTLQVRFSGKSLTATGNFSMLTGSDGKTYGKLDFNKYMVQFVSDRYVTFEIQSKKVTGLKIPVSSVTQKTFYLVPVGYLAQGGDGDQSTTGFMKETYSEQGTSVEFVPTTIYYSTEEYYYIDLSDAGSTLKPGDYIVKPTGVNVAEADDAQDVNGETEAETNESAAQTAKAAESGGRFQLGASASLQGVYNINKGYAVFKQIEVLASNAEFDTIKKGMRYGLSVFDHIVLDASSVEEGKLIYQ